MIHRDRPHAQRSNSCDSSDSPLTPTPSMQKSPNLRQPRERRFRTTVHRAPYRQGRHPRQLPVHSVAIPAGPPTQQCLGVHLGSTGPGGLWPHTQRGTGGPTVSNRQRFPSNRQNHLITWLAGRSNGQFVPHSPQLEVCLHSGTVVPAESAFVPSPRLRTCSETFFSASATGHPRIATRAFQASWLASA